MQISNNGIEIGGKLEIHRALDDPKFKTFYPAPGPVDWLAIRDAITTVTGNSKPKAEERLKDRRRNFGDLCALHMAERIVAYGAGGLWTPNPDKWEQVKPVWYVNVGPNGDSIQ